MKGFPNASWAHDFEAEIKNGASRKYIAEVAWMNADQGLAMQILFKENHRLGEINEQADALWSMLASKEDLILALENGAPLTREVTGIAYTRIKTV